MSGSGLEKHHPERRKNSNTTVRVTKQMHSLLHAARGAEFIEKGDEGKAYVELRDAYAVLMRINIDEREDTVRAVTDENFMSEMFGVSEVGISYIRKKLFFNKNNDRKNQ